STWALSVETWERPQIHLRAPSPISASSAMPKRMKTRRRRLPGAFASAGGAVSSSTAAEDVDGFMDDRGLTVVAIALVFPVPSDGETGYLRSRAMPAARASATRAVAA